MRHLEVKRLQGSHKRRRREHDRPPCDAPRKEQHRVVRIHWGALKLRRICDRNSGNLLLLTPVKSPLDSLGSSLMSGRSRLERD